MLDSPRRFLLLSVAAMIVVMAGRGTIVAQAPKDKAKRALIPEPLEINPGDPLSSRALVTRPLPIKTARSWTVETKRHRWQAIHVSVSPDGALAATSGYDGMIRIWDLTTGKFVRVLVGHSYYSHGVAWSPDGTMLATTGGSDGTARVWNPKTGMTLRVLKGHKGATGALAWAPDSKHLVVTGGSSGFATFWDVPQNKQLKTVEHGTGVYSVAWSPDGKMVACGVGGGGFLWNAENYENIRTMKQDGVTVLSVAFSPDSKNVLTGGFTNCVVWGTDEGKKGATIDGPANAASWCPNGKFIAIAPSGGAVQLFGTNGFKPFKTLPLNAGSMSWTKDGKSLVTVNIDKLMAYDVAAAKITQSITVALSANLSWTAGKPIIAGIGDKSPTLWDTVTGKWLQTLNGHAAPVGVSLWSRDGKLLATGSADMTARVWDGATYKFVREHAGHGSTVSALAWSPENKLATGSADKIVRIFSPSTDSPRELKGHSHPITSVAWSRDGKTLASSASDRIILWNLETDTPLKTIQVERDVAYISISPDGKLLVSGSVDGVMRIWNVSTGKFVHKYDAAHITCTAWSNDSSLLAFGNGNSMGIVSVKGENKPVSAAIYATVCSISWTPDSKTVATTSIDRTLRFWDASNGRLRATLVADDKQFVAISAEGYFRTAPEIESELVYVIQTEKSQDTMEPKAFWAKHAWRNNAAAVKLNGN